MYVKRAKISTRSSATVA